MILGGNSLEYDFDHDAIAPRIVLLTPRPAIGSFTEVDITFAIELHKTLSEQGLSVDHRHNMLVSDVMTNTGSIQAIGRHGISGSKVSVLARAAFEITSTHLLQAGLTGETDVLVGVAENIIVGQPVHLGTGAVSAIYKPRKKKARKSSFLFRSRP